MSKVWYNAGVLFKRGRNYRLSPDLLADFVIQQTCIGPDGQSPGYAEKVFAHAQDDQLKNLVTNISKLDWRLSKSDISSARVLDAVWGQLETQVQEAPSQLMNTISPPICTTATRIYIRLKYSRCSHSDTSA